MSSLEDLIKQELGSSKLEKAGGSGAGCISEGSAYETDLGKVFIKFNGKPEAMRMFEGEFESLSALKSADQVRVPKPIKAIKNPKGGGMLVMEYIEMHSLSRHAGKLGEQLARLHLLNAELGRKGELAIGSIHEKGKYEGHVIKFGFPISTCCGYIPQENDWMDSWTDFFARKIDQHVRLAEEKYGDREVRTVWSNLVRGLPKMFQEVDIIPALLHGDLWGGNGAETDQGPVIYDPASFYGHAEYDLAISKMFGGFGSSYFTSYHKLIPKAQGFDDRLDLYMMFHYFNHWNHFGGGYRGSTLNIMKRLVKKYS